MSQYLSPEGLEKLKNEMADLKTTVRRSVADRIESAKSLGDLSENAEYQEAKDAQSQNEARIAELEDILRDAVLISAKHRTDVVDIGSTVEVESDSAGKINYTIVGSEEADPINGKISNESPLGSAFLGKKIGDRVDVRIPAGTNQFTIRAIS
ncbi:MAG: transcription elongation factor GreA [Candidatus Sungbacteria bacterium RIFCSPLOWO2_02_FULL_48_13b]|uniref:Transcription elongation factor GreA n=2 Tax=Candidatus Sungiibacteriota TaxID=1817917 RepID=A0A1G2LH80_9BACT|nr:MAG: transcription elongation factor GreA [Candidatus Sungbacteria bacterium RIFCSPHIGHO2_02_FULL_49_20]OHA10970.1 MAG: transcription elongation factor GreA [Candidatus Sungbacteria bacterium RIFCSPLOWO2_02_FULL_48_13b]